MNQRTILLSVLALCVATLFVVAGTYAYFTTSTTTSSNLFQTGTISIGTEPTSAAFNVSNLAPGRTETATIRVRNGGNLDLDYHISAEKKKGYSTVYNALTARITDTSDGSVLYDGPLSALAAGPVTLPAGSHDDLQFRVGLPAECGNDLMDSYCSVDFDFDAEQPH